jgi:hypothetical protein
VIARQRSAAAADEVIGVLNVQITRRHLWMAVAFLAAAGVAVAAGGTSASTSIGAAALVVAGAVALLERGQGLLPRVQPAAS